MTTNYRSSPMGGFFARVTNGLRQHAARVSERRSNEAVGFALIRSGDPEMMELGRQILGGRPVSEVFGN
jgi:hypothetical protein